MASVSSALDLSTAKLYLSSQLEIDDVETKLARSSTPGVDRLSLLNEVLNAYLNHEPYHNLRMLMESSQDKSKYPDLETLIQNVLSLEGGMCIELNFFLAHLLAALGFNQELILASVAVPELMNHALNIVRDVVENGDCYLVEAGFALPSFGAIPLNFCEGETSEEKHQSDLIYRIALRDGVYIREHKILPNKRVLFPLEKDGWTQAIFFKVQPCSLKNIEDDMNKTVYLDPDYHFKRRIFAMAYNNFKKIQLINNTLEVEDDEGNFVVTALKTAEDIKEAIKKYFPRIPVASIDPAVDYWRKVREAGREFNL